jgi:predicted RNA polymerase sigma factor
MVALNRAVAIGMADGPSAGLALLEPLDRQLSGHHRLYAVRAHLLEMGGDVEAASRDSGPPRAGRPASRSRST